MSFGRQTVTFVTVSEDPNNRDRYNKPEKVRTPVPVAGCRFRPLTFREKQELGDIATEAWRCTAPPDPAVMSATAVDEVIVDGVTYQIVGGVRTFVDMVGRPFKVTVQCEKRES